jgi:hypothetical protein
VYDPQQRLRVADFLDRYAEPLPVMILMRHRFGVRSSRNTAIRQRRAFPQKPLLAVVPAARDRISLALLITVSVRQRTRPGDFVNIDRFRRYLKKHKKQIK